MRKLAWILSLACSFSLFAQTSPHWKPLKDGNDAFQGTYITFDRLDVLRGGLVGGQNPPVTVLSCSDSRVPPELAMRQTLGQIFLVRSAGNVTDSLGIASIEYALGVKKWTKLLVILAHEKCGAVEEAMKPRPTPTPENHNLLDLIDKIQEAFKGQPPCPNPNDKEACWLFKTRQNAVYTIADLKKRSPIIRKAIEGGLPVVIGYYQLKTGRIIVWDKINN